MELTDNLLEGKIESLKSTIQKWAVKNDIWEYSGFTNYLDHFEYEPTEIPAVLVLYSDGKMINVLNYEYDKLSIEFEQLIDQTEFYYEMHDGVTAVFYPIKEELYDPFYNYFEWKWICEILKPNYTSLYEEVFQVIKNDPKRLHQLTPRQFEIYIHELFKNQGYDTEIGSGFNDGGVDIRLYQKDSIDQIVTLVQVKRYHEGLPIKLDAVAALNSHVNDQKANRGLFVTTSRYLPVAKKFANRQDKKLILADKTHIEKWSNLSATKIIKDKSSLVTDEHILKIIGKDYDNGLEGKIVHASVGYNCIRNEFGIILKETPNACLIMLISKVMVKSYDPPHNFRGEEVPVIRNKIVELRNKENVFRAKKNIDELGRFTFWGKQTFYILWDEKPKYFDLLD